MTERIEAPWTPAQVAALNTFQESGRFHPFTCGNRENHPEDRYYLVATVRGWICPFCDYTQAWAHPVMVEPLPANPMSLDGLLLGLPVGDVAYSRNHDTGAWEVHIFKPHSTEIIATVATNMDKGAACWLKCKLQDALDARGQRGTHGKQ